MGRFGEELNNKIIKEVKRCPKCDSTNVDFVVDKELKVRGYVCIGCLNVFHVETTKGNEFQNYIDERRD